MNYWPMSLIKNSSLMPPQFAWEMAKVYETYYLTPHAFDACLTVARQTKPIDTGLTVIESTDAPTRRVYSDYPLENDWLRLERGGVIEIDDGTMYVIIDALH